MQHARNLMPFREIAEIIGEDLRTVRKDYEHAMRKLGLAWDDDELIDATYPIPPQENPPHVED